MKILVISPGEFIGDNLEVGQYYNAELSEDGTEKQNKLFHSLVQEYWASGQHSYNARSFQHFRALMKLFLGAGMEEFCNLINEDGTPCPEGRADYRLKSWANYTKKERRETIDRVIAEMVQVGINTKKFDEILKTLEENSLETDKNISKRLDGGYVV